MSAKNRSGETTEAWWALLTAILKSMRNRPVAWLVGVWLSGWVLFAWHTIHLASWNAVWGTVNNVLARAHSGQPANGQASSPWLHEVARWGQIALYMSTGILVLYATYAMWVWWRYMCVGMPKVREERLRGGRVLEVLIPRGSMADARASADMFGQLWNLLGDMAVANGSFGLKKMGAEQLALSLEMWSTPHTGGKIGFYVWCPATGVEQHEVNSRAASSKESDNFIEEVRQSIKVFILVPACAGWMIL